MKKFVLVDGSGQPLYTTVPSDWTTMEDGAELIEGTLREYTGVEDDSFILASVYWKEGWKVRPVRPSNWHTWDVSSESWLPNLDAARASRLQEVATELNRRLYLPCNGFDADNVSRERISGMIARLQRGDGLPAGWMGWRDAANEMRWADADPATVLANLTALSCAIEDREQALLVTSWAHKAAIAALEDIDAILGYDVTTGWPT